MRQDQIEAMDDLAEALADVFASEADPKNWSGAGQAATEMDTATRGARNWDMKNANQSGALLMRVLDLRERLRGVRSENPGDTPDDRAEHDIAKFEKVARKALERIGAKP